MTRWYISPQGALREGTLEAMSRPARWRRTLAQFTWTASCALALTGAPTASAAAAQPVGGAACSDWRACRDEALVAEAASDAERFHDLAWRTVQLGPKDEPELMYLLARAQATSGRPSDAVVMLQRLARMGVATDADTLEVFRRVRARQAWADVEALATTATRRVTAASGLEARGATTTTATTTATTSTAPTPASTGVVETATPPPVAAAVRPSVRVGTPLQGVVAVQLDGLPVASGGFAYDAVSGRFLVGSADERKIVVVDEPSRRAADLVRGDSAGFRHMVAMRIDTRRGDLWVVSNDAGAAGPPGGATLHKLQLIAGRPLGRLEAPASDGPVRFTDLTVTPSGSVLLVDAAGRRLYRASPRAASLSAAVTLDLAEPVALASADSDDVVYVAHAGGVSRVDLARRVSQPIAVPPDLPQDGIAGVWWHDGALVVMRAEGNGARHLQRWDLDRTGTAVTGVRPLDVPLPDTSSPVAVTLAGTDLFVMAGLPGTGGSNGAGASSDALPLQLVVHRVRLRP